MSDEHYGVRALPELYKEWAATGMVANIGTRIVEVAHGKLVLEGNMTGESHGFPTSSRGGLLFNAIKCGPHAAETVPESLTR